MQQFKILLFAALSLLLVPATFAQTPLTPSFTTGMGANESYMVVDFQDGTAHPSFVFGYKYDGAKTALDMVEALDAAASPSVKYVPGYSPTDGSPFGVAIYSFTYDGHSQAGFDANGSWGYYLKDSGAWESSSYGVNSRALMNGSYDGWSWDTGTAPLPRDTNPVPEASTLVSLALLLALGAGGVVVSTRKKIRA